MWTRPLEPRYYTESIILPGAIFLLVFIWLLYDCAVFTRQFWLKLGGRIRDGLSSIAFLLKFLFGCLSADDLKRPQIADDDEDDEVREQNCEIKTTSNDVAGITANDGATSVRAEFIDPRCGDCGLCEAKADCPMKSWRTIRFIEVSLLALSAPATLVAVVCAAFTLSMKLVPKNTEPNTDAGDNILGKLRSLELEYNVMWDLVIQAATALILLKLVSRRRMRVASPKLTLETVYTFTAKIAALSCVRWLAMVPAMVSVVLSWIDVSKPQTSAPLSVIWTALYAVVFVLVLACAIASLVATFRQRNFLEKQRRGNDYAASSHNELDPANKNSRRTQGHLQPQLAGTGPHDPSADMGVGILENNIDTQVTSDGERPQHGGVTNVDLRTPGLMAGAARNGMRISAADETPDLRGQKVATKAGETLLKVIYRDRSWYFPCEPVEEGCGCRCCSPTNSFRVDRSNRETKATFLARLTFQWLTPFIQLGYSRPLDASDLYEIPKATAPEVCEARWEKLWRKERAEKGAQASFLKTIFRFCRSSLIRAASLKVFYDCLTFVGPTVLNILTRFLAKCEWAIYDPAKAEKRTFVGQLYLEGVGAALLLMAANLTMTALLHQYFHIQTKCGISVRAALLGTIYSKSLRISGGVEPRAGNGPPNGGEPESRSRRCFGLLPPPKPLKRGLVATTTGEIVNLMSVDVSRIHDVMMYIHLLWSSPLQIVISLVLLWRQLGVSTVAGVGVMCISIPLTGFVSRAIKSAQEDLMQVRDERIKVTNEVLAGMKIIKMYAWEESFRNKVEEIRSRELKCLWRYRCLTMFQRTFWYVVPVLVSIVSFLTYVSTGHTLDAATAFTAVALFNTLRFPLTILPMMITFVLEAYVAAQRIDRFLSRPEVQPLPPPPDQNITDRSAKTIVARHLTVRWPDGAPLLDDVSFSAAPGTITAVIGRTGSGKTGLLACLTGDLASERRTLDGSQPSSVEINGRVAYVAQTAWIMNATLRDNITFGMPFNAAWYSKVVHACALTADLEILPAGDMTEIGEKGVNLSGGQKQRVSLARAVYRSGQFPARNSPSELPADIYLLDDCLSAVDSHVGQHIFVNAINGILKKHRRTVIFVTHKVDVLPEVDNILFLGRRNVLGEGELGDGAGADGRANDVPKAVGEGGSTAPGAGVGILLGSGSHTSLQNRSDYLDFTEEVRREEEAESENGGAVTPAGDFSSVSASRGPTPQSRAGPGSSVAPSPTPSLQNFLAPVVASDDGLRESPCSELEVGAEAIRSGVPVREGSNMSGTGNLGGGDSVFSERDELRRCPRGTLSRTTHRGLHGSESIQTTDSMFEFAERIRNNHAQGHKDGDGGTPSNEVPAGKLMEIETAATGSVAADVYLGYFKGFGGARMLIAVICTVVLAQGAQVGANTWISYWSDHSATIQGLPTGIGVYSGLCLTQVVFLASNFFLFAYAAQKAARYFHNELITYLVRAPMSFFDTTPLGRILNRFSKDIYAVDQTLPQMISEYIANFFLVFATFMVVIVATKWFAVICIPVIYIYASIQKFYIPSGRQIQRIDSVLRSPIFAHFGETLDGVATIRAYRVQDRFRRSNLEKIHKNQRSSYALVSANRWLAVRLETIGTTVVFSAAILAVIGGLTGGISAGVGGLAISYALNITQSLNWMVRMANDVETNIVSVERLQEYSQGALQEAPPIIDDRRPPDAWPQAGEIDILDYKLRYRKKLPLVLSGIDVHVSPCEKVGVVGRTGAGKSSLLVALLRIVEGCGGVITVDGVDVAKIGLYDLRSKFSIIPQDPILFTGSLRFNLDPFSRYTDEEVWLALERAHLKHFVAEEFQGGLMGGVEEGGRNLSMGQKQLICLARALLRNSRILLLDEATSAVDPLTDRLIQQTIRSYFNQCTVFTIAHRIATILDYDKILVLDNGRVAEFDSPSILMRRPNGLFRQLCADSGIDVDAPLQPTTAQ